MPLIYREQCQGDWAATRKRYIAKYEDQTPPEYVLRMGDLNILMRFAGVRAQAMYRPGVLFSWELVWVDFDAIGERYFISFESMRAWVDRRINFLVDDKLKVA